MIKVILYDLDGVLVDACNWHYDALNKALLEIYGFKLSRQEHESTFNGLPTLTKLGILRDQGRVLEEDFSRVSRLKQEYTAEFSGSLKPDPVKIALHTQVASRGLKVACVTNSIRKTVEVMLTNTGQRPFMEFVISNEDITHPKPCGEGYVVAMIRLQALPQETLIVEDAPRGLEAAYCTGAHVLQVENAAALTWPILRECLDGRC